MDRRTARAGTQKDDGTALVSVPSSFPPLDCPATYFFFFALFAESAFAMLSRLAALSALAFPWIVSVVVVFTTVSVVRIGCPFTVSTPFVVIVSALVLSSFFVAQAPAAASAVSATTNRMCLCMVVSMSSERSSNGSPPRQATHVPATGADTKKRDVARTSHASL